MVYEYETTSTFGGLIRSFNVTTNQWSGKYIFKRLKFLRSKFLSHLFTLIYLALWHGWKSGYYVTFTIELLIMKMEWEVSLSVSVSVVLPVRQPPSPDAYSFAPSILVPLSLSLSLLRLFPFLILPDGCSTSLLLRKIVSLSNVFLTDRQNGHSFL